MGADPKSVDVAIFAPTIHIPAAQVLVGKLGLGGVVGWVEPMEVVMTPTKAGDGARKSLW